MDAEQTPRMACAWCGKDATHNLILVPGKGLKLAKTAPVCLDHWQHFHSLDECPEHTSGDEW